MVVALGRVDGVGILAVFLIELDCCGGGRFRGHESSESILGGNAVEFGGIDCLRHRDFHAGSVPFGHEHLIMGFALTSMSEVARVRGRYPTHRRCYGQPSQL